MTKRVKNPEWMELAVRRYVDDVATYPRGFRAARDEIIRIQAEMEGVPGVRYDKDGSPAPWHDKLAEHVDAIAAKRDEMAALTERWAATYIDAMAIFNADEDAYMVWERWGLKTPWKRIAKRRMYVVETCRLRMPKGIAYIYERMPEEYRRSPYGAEDRRV